MISSRYLNSRPVLGGAMRRCLSIHNPSLELKNLKRKVIKNEHISLGDLSALLKICTEPFHYKYALKGVNLYQSLGSDFNQEVCSLFIQVCVKGGKVESAAEIVSNPDQRIGSWVTQKSLHTLINGLLSTESGVTLAAKSVVTSQKKGLQVANQEIVDAIIDKAKLENKTDDEWIKQVTSISLHR